MPIWRIVVASTVIGIAGATYAYSIEGFFQSLLISLSTAFLSLALALVVVNGFLNHKERKEAALVVLHMILKDVGKYHNDFNRRGRDIFGIPEWQEILKSMNEHRRNPDTLSPEQRTRIVQMLESKKDDLLGLTSTMEDGLRELTYILGWNFHPKVVRDAMLSRMEISKIQNLLTLDERDEQQTKDLIENYFDLDADSSAVLESLATMTNTKITE